MPTGGFLVSPPLLSIVGTSRPTSGASPSAGCALFASFPAENECGLLGSPCHESNVRASRGRF